VNLRYLDRDTPQYPDLAKVATVIKNFGNIGAHGNTIPNFNSALEKGSLFQ
jgi:hypothetical protein